MASPKETEDTDKKSSGEQEETKTASSNTPSLARNGNWAAVWSAEANKYYFWNRVTNETTWENPIVKEDTAPIAPTREEESANRQEEEVEDTGGIDPDLAYLDPTMSANKSSGSRAMFNHKGVFTKDSTRNPDHVSEYSRARRQNAAFFDVDAWEAEMSNEQGRKRELDEQGAESKQKRLSKRQVQSFKDKRAEKRQKKQRAWLLS